MVSLAVDDKGNLQVGSEIKTLKGFDSLVQDIKTRLRLVQGEYHFDITQGLPYFELFQNNNKLSFEREILTEILKDERVKNAIILRNDFDNGKLNLEIEVTTTENQMIRI